MRPRYPRMTAVVGDVPQLRAYHGGRGYYPHIVMHAVEGDEDSFDDKLTVNAGGNQCRQPDDAYLSEFDRLALLFAAAPALLATVQQYASECAACDGTGVDSTPTGSGKTYPCGECESIRDVIAKATGDTQR